MLVSTMRTVDRYAGVPLCWATGVWNDVVRVSIPQPRTILVMKFFGLGSILLTTPFLSMLRSQFPTARVLYLSFSPNLELLKKLPFQMERLTISTSSLKSFVIDTFRVLRYIRRAKIDVVFDLEFFSKFSTLVSVLSRATMRVGYDLPTFWRRSNLTHPIPLDHSRHVTKVFLQQLDAFGISHREDIRLSQFEASVEDRISMEHKLGIASEGVDLIAVNINAGSTSLERRWDATNFFELIESLHNENPSRHFFLIGNEAERRYIERSLSAFAHLRGSVENVAGTLSVGELIALLQRSRFLLTNDSGPMHLASAVGTPVIALFGPESPQFYGPVGEARILYKGIHCSPCLNVYNAKLFVCPYDARCMKEISVDEVLAAVHSLETPSAMRSIPLALRT
jgi:heptosyltransferase-3